VRRPYVVGEAIFPERQTGLQVYGTWGFGPSQVGYYLTLSNGRGPIDTYQDLDHNKAFGARLFWKQETDFGAVTVGTSGYRGKYTDSVNSFGIDAAGSIALTEVVTTRYDELSLALDAKWEWGGLLVQAEGILGDIAYADPYRVSDPGFTGGPPGFAPDHRRLGLYGLAGYRSSFFGLMPFGGGEYYDPGQGFAPPSVGLWGGLNWRQTPRVVVKAQYTHVAFPGSTTFASADSLDLQIAWSF
jgi:hypothetical protein